MARRVESLLAVFRMPSGEQNMVCGGEEGIGSRGLSREHVDCCLRESGQRERGLRDIRRSHLEGERNSELYLPRSGVGSGDCRALAGMHAILNNEAHYSLCKLQIATEFLWRGCSRNILITPFHSREEPPGWQRWR